MKYNMQAVGWELNKSNNDPPLLKPPNKRPYSIVQEQIQWKFYLMKKEQHLCQIQINQEPVIELDLHLFKCLETVA